MKFGLNFGLQRHGSGGAPAPAPAPVYSNTQINFTNPPGTYDFVILPNGFEIELYGDGNQGAQPTVSIETDEIVPAGSMIEFTVTVEQLSGSNILAYSFFNFFSAAGILDTTNGTTTDKACLSATSVPTDKILIQFNETKSGRMRITDLSFKIV